MIGLVDKWLLQAWFLILKPITVSMKTKQAIKYIIKHPDIFTEGEQAYAKLIKKQRKLRKQLTKENEQS